MAMARTAKVQAEIDKTREKIAEQQARLKELEAKRTELENLEIVDIVRGMSIPLENLGEILQSLKNGTIPAFTSGQAGSKSKNIISQNDGTGKEADAE